MIGHIEGGETGVGVPEHGLNSVVSVYSAPSSTSLPHPIEDSAYFQGIIPVSHSNSPGPLAGGITALNRYGIRPAQLRLRPWPEFGRSGEREVGEDGLHGNRHSLCKDNEEREEHSLDEMDKSSILAGISF